MWPFTLPATHTQVACYKCQLPIVLENGHLAKLKQTGEMFWCSAGHGQVFTPSENTKLKQKVATLEKQLASMTEDRDRWIQRRNNGIEEERRLGRRIYALRGVITRMNNKKKRDERAAGTTPS